MGSADDNVGSVANGADLDTGVALLSELTLEELVDLGVEHTVGDVLALQGNLLVVGGRHLRL